MNKFNLKCPIRKVNPYRRMAKDLKTSNGADNLLKSEFKEHRAKVVITYMIYGNSQKVYFSTIIDAYTKEILSYVLSDFLEVDFVLEIVNILIRDYGISLTKEKLIHSD